MWLMGNLWTIFMAFCLFDVSKGACPAGFTLNPIHWTCLKVLPEKTSWSQAREKCAELGSMLVSVDSDAMVAFMSDVADKNGLHDFWLQQNDLWTEGDYRSLDGKRVTHFYWYSGAIFMKQPSDSPSTHGQNCLSQGQASQWLYKSFWWDNNCEDSKTPICEFWPERKKMAFKQFKKTQEPPIDHYNVEVIQTLPPMSKTSCAAVCVHNLLCDAIGRKTSEPTSGNCYLMTLKQQFNRQNLDSTVNKMIGYDLFMVSS